MIVVGCVSGMYVKNSSPERTSNVRFSLPVGMGSVAQQAIGVLVFCGYQLYRPLSLNPGIPPYGSFPG